MNRPTSTRRGFLAASAAAAGTLAFGSRAHGETGEPFPPGKYVDFHTHFGHVWGGRAPLDAEGLLFWMDRNDVAQAVVMPLVSPESWDHPITTNEVLKGTLNHRDRLIPFCSIDPRTINLGSYESKRDLIQRYVDAGARGFGEHKVGIPIDDPRNIEMFTACGEVGIPVLFHLDNSRNTDKPGLPGLEAVLQACPDTIFVGHAQGWWASISGDVTQEQLQLYPTSEVAEGGAIDRLMDTYPNIYGDLSAGSGSNAIMRDMEFGREFVLRRADRLLFATDYLSPGQKCLQFDLYNELDLPEDVQAKVFRDNARRLLGLLPA